jgi:ATP phosphoribosyltransferase regulatory subunit
MTDSNRWLLPEGIEEALPPLAERLETCRRQLLDLYHAWGYELVMPPLIEYLESLLIGTGHDLDLQTFKLTDQMNGRLMGVRADMTPQVARIDAHSLKRDVPTRLCYMGTVLHTRPDGFAGSRSPLQVGAELYGHAGVDGDVEMIRLMLETFRVCGVQDVFLDLGHVGIYRCLAEEAGLSDESEAQLFDMLQRKALPEIREYLATLDMSDAARGRLLALAELNGGPEVLDEASKRLAGAGEAVIRSLDVLGAIASAVARRYPKVALHVDLAELRGFHYHTGAVFAAYVGGHGQELARGGRYDDIGRVFGRARPATGFSTDLKTLVRLSSEPLALPARAIFAPPGGDDALDEAVQSLRARGERVIQGLEGQDNDARRMGCDRILALDSNNQWTVTEV